MAGLDKARLTTAFWMYQMCIAVSLKASAPTKYRVPVSVLKQSKQQTGKRHGSWRYMGAVTLSLTLGGGSLRARTRSARVFRWQDNDWLIGQTRARTGVTYKPRTPNLARARDPSSPSRAAGRAICIRVCSDNPHFGDFSWNATSSY